VGNFLGKLIWSPNFRYHVLPSGLIVGRHFYLPVLVARTLVVLSVAPSLLTFTFILLGASKLVIMLTAMEFCAGI
jgi:hypothetical protein